MRAMTLKKKLLVLPRGQQWEVRRAGAAAPRTRHDSFEAARRAGLTVARFERGAVTIHRPNGQIGETVSFRPRPTRRRERHAAV